MQDPHATKQLHQILDPDAFQRAHRLLHLARERVINAISNEAIKFLDCVFPGKGMRSEARGARQDFGGGLAARYDLGYEPYR